MRDVRALIVGSGAREHAFFREFNSSPRAQKVIWTPGNAGVSALYRRAVPDSDVAGIVALTQEEGINFVFVGPEAPLVAGIVDELAKVGVPAFGPSKAAALLESSKIFTKTRCRLWKIPTADSDFAGNLKTAEHIIKSRGFRVIKADGLCAGKGVVVADSENEAIKAARDMLEGGIHGRAGSRIVIEERLQGTECSLMFLCDGVNALALPAARDFKRIYDGDTGPNTGGMGAYSPLPDVSHDLVEEVRTKFILPMLAGMMARNEPFRGCLYAGLMLTDDGPKLVEYNVRFGDPETQVVLPRVESDIVEYLIAASRHGGLGDLPPLGIKQTAVVGVTLAAKGYPGTPEKGAVIQGSEKHLVFHAGTADRDGSLCVNGGRVMTVIGEGATIADARANAYLSVNDIRFEGMQHRTDIAANA